MNTRSFDRSAIHDETLPNATDLKTVLMLSGDYHEPTVRDVWTVLKRRVSVFTHSSAGDAATRRSGPVANAHIH